MKTVEDVQTWRGMKMVDADGDKIGTAEDIFLDRQTGEPAWAAVRDRALRAASHTLVPIREAEVRTEDDEIRVPFQKEQVKNAPEYRLHVSGREGTHASSKLLVRVRSPSPA